MSQATLSPNPYRNSNLFSGRYLDEHVYELDAWDCDAEAREAFEAINDLYETEKDALSSYDEPPLRNNWIDEVLEALGYEPLEETPLVDARGSIDRTLYDTKGDKMAAAVMKADGEHTEMYGQALSILEAKQWDANFTDRFSDQRSYRDASHQLKSYLEHTPESISWGILTNGKKWRLYGTKDYETETYYEIDLPELLESGSVEKFKYFYVLFRPGAFRESAGTTFLDTVWSESETAAQELGEDLQDNVFTALRVLGEGFVETNELDIDPADDERLAELKEQSLVLLYRLMFVLYAESRDLIDPEDPARRSEYEENFSLGVLRNDIREEVGETPGELTFEREFSEYSFSMWNRLERLFSLVDTGNDDLGIPPYNGGLFDEERHEFLREYEVANSYIAEVIYRLSTTATDEGFVPADYSDLDTRHLGTIYEGLLEHEFAVAPEAQAAVAENGGEVWKSTEDVSVAEAVETVEKGELYVVNDEGERKATGAYYTPDYVVTYIVEETVGPLLSDIEMELAEMGMEPGTQEYVVAFWERVTDLKILDPAMGSGHFLTKATGYLAEAMMEQVRELETGRLFDEEQVRREISKECIYGVDINGMAVELAKLSMWLETLAADQPLAFLDHHLKAGNSLVGSDITEVLSNDDGDAEVVADDAEGLVQSSLFDYFDQVRRQALDHVMDLMGELLAIDNETLEDVHSMEEIYKRIREDPLYEHLQAMATVHTAGEFGLDVPEDAIERMARAIEDEDEWAALEETDWFRAAQAMADEEGFFHWELEFPVVFFDGDRLASAGFDAVVGNPPYVRVQGEIEQYLRDTYQSPQYFVDLFHVFIETGIEINRNSGQFGFIVPEPWLTMENTEQLREYLLNNVWMRQITRFEKQVFAAATVDTVVLSLEKSEPADVDVIDIDNIHNEITETSLINTVSQERFKESPEQRIEIRQTKEEQNLLDRITRTNAKFQDIAEISIGIQAYNSSKHTQDVIESRAFHADHKVSEEYYPEISGQDVSRYRIRHDGETWVQYGDHLHDYRPMRFFSEPRVLVREITDAGRYKIHAGYTDQTMCNYKTVLNILPDNGYSPYYLLAVLNASLMSWIFPRTSNKVVSDTFPRISVADIENLPIPEIAPTSTDPTVNPEDDLLEPYEAYLRAGDMAELLSKIDTEEERCSMLTMLAKRNGYYVEQKDSNNLNLPDYLGTYEDGPTLGERYQPASGLAESVLTDTAADSEFETLRVTGAQVERDGDRLRVLAVPYVKPDDPDAYDTNSRGYATLDPVPAMEFVGLSEAEADLIEAFVPHAVKEAGGFAGYRDNATATISPLDRLESLTLPKLADVEGGIERYIETTERAAELDEKIERTDELIDEIVYELYGLTDEEIEIVEESVDD